MRTLRFALLAVLTIAAGQAQFFGGIGGGSASTNGVPYTGAVRDVNLGAHTLTAQSLSTNNTGSSGMYVMGGATNGAVGWAAAASANGGGAAILYLLPSTAGTAGYVLSDTGAVTCPPLPDGAPAVCHQLTWIAQPTGTGAGPAVAVGLAIDQNTTANQMNYVVWPTPIFDTSGGSMWNSGNPTRLVAPSTGYYLLMLQLSLNNNGGRAGCGKNGTVTGSANWLVSQEIPSGALSYNAYSLVHLTANDYVECGVWQYNGNSKMLGYPASASFPVTYAELVKLF